ncbi:MAG: hypothetical protein PWR30_148 [Candidatus Woesearchaeota archaeon]|nr:hypothetical protein [Candidatus Woesearchaeota archaeon]
MMKKNQYRLFLAIFCSITFVFLANLVSSLDSYPVTFSLFDLYTNSEIYANKVLINADYADDGVSKSFSFEAQDEGISPVELMLEEGKWDFYITADDFSTPQIDYQIIHSLRVEGPVSQRLYLLEVGTVNGIVKDKAGKLVSGAKVKFECERTNFVGELETDIFGSFSTNIVPAGKCKVFASYQNSVGISEIVVDKGNVSDVEVTLDEEVVRRGFGFYALLWILIAVLVFILFFFIFRRHKRKKDNEDINEDSRDEKEKKDMENKDKVSSKSLSHDLEIDDDIEISEIIDYSFKEQPKSLPKRSIDILNSLSEGEQKIVRFIIDQGNQTTQARINRIAKIPKSTLHRNIKTLEEKGIVKIEKKNGRNVVYLTDYFLSEH